MAGMPVGPLSLNDEIGVDLAWKIMQGDRSRSRREGGRSATRRRCSTRLVEKHGRLGRKNGKGFYDYPAEARRRRLWPGLADLQPTEARSRHDRRRGAEAAPPRHAGAGSGALLRGGRRHRPARGRCRLDPRLRLRAVHGRHAVLYRHDGDEDFVALCEKLEKKFGERFKPSTLLLDMAARARPSTAASRRRRSARRLS